MTAKDILANAAGLLSEIDAAEYETYAVSWFNLLIAEMFYVNNRILMYKKMHDSVLDEPPFITDIEDEIEYEWELTSQAFVFGVCKMIYLQENDPSMLGFYEQKYTAAVNDADRNVVSADYETYNSAW